MLNIIFESLRRSIYAARPEIRELPGIDMALTYIISGLSSVASKHRREPTEERAKQAGRATAAILREFV
ncbi:MAG: hypothetical protein LBH17_06565 [Oscillospiraceae bacterium]|nr:hypothetical protein [Oscillospiraceae bacterium]